MGWFKKAKQENFNSASATNLAELALYFISDGVIIVDAENRILLINPAAMEMLEVKGVEYALGINFLGVLKLEEENGSLLEEQKNPIVQALANNQAFTCKNLSIVKEKSGKRVPVRISVQPTSSEKSNAIITMHDIESEKREESAQMEFISTASHEMRTPVASIEGYLGLAINPATATIDERARKYLEAAHEASKHLGQLFQDLLDVTKMEDKKIPIHLQPVELSDLVRKLAEGHQVATQAKHIKLQIGNTGAFNGKIAQLIYVSTDVEFMREILGNLIDNAIKYTPENGQITVKVAGDLERALICVEDTGIGIASEDLTKIFQKFYRVDNTDTRTIGGTGLGLFLVKQRVETLGGKVWVESQLGKGSKFFVMLPRLSEAEFQRQKIAWDNQEQAMRLKAEITKRNETEMNVAQPEQTQQPQQSTQEQAVVGKK